MFTKYPRQISFPTARFIWFILTQLTPSEAVANFSVLLQITLLENTAKRSSYLDYITYVVSDAKFALRGQETSHGFKLFTTRSL